jgi:MCP family monocarboxylic acid transporter-like MFS transporter 10
MMHASLIAGVLTIIWPYTRETATLVTIAVTYGASSSAMMAFGDCADVGRRTGMYLTIVSLGVLAGPLISGAISHSTGGYTGVGFFAAA